MKLTSFLPILAALCALVAPASVDARDKRDNHDNDRRESDRRESARRDNDRRGSDNRGSHDDHRRHDHRGPNVIIRPTFGSGYGYYGSAYSSPYYHRHSPYYYSRPTLGLTYSSRPSTIYRGQAVYGSYSDSLAVDVQRELRRRGYYRGPIDGDIGPGSRSSIRAYQDDRGLSVTGRIDSSLLRSLGLD